MKLQKNKKDNTNNLTLDSISNFINNYRPAIIAYLMQGQNFDGTDLTSTLLDLITRKYLLMEEEYRIEDLLDNTKNIIIKLNNNENINELKEYEKYLIEWFINELEKKGEIKTSQLRETLKNDINSGEKFLLWQNLVIKEFNKEQFIVDSDYKKDAIAGFGYSMFAFVGVLIIFPNAPFTLPYIIIFIAHLFTIKSSFNNLGRAKKLTDKGEEVTKNWNGFKEYINTYSIINEKHVLHVSLYEKYFVYSVALNIADKVNKDMSKKYGWELYKIN